MASFNSRYLSYTEISSFFIPTQNFKRLISPCHSILLGARGCGKTTMLKMLQPEAEYAFSQKEGAINIPFYGIYIPSDRQWSLILEQLSSNDENEFMQKMSKALVNINVLLAFLETLKAIGAQKKIADNEMYEFCKGLIICWKIDSNIPPIIDILGITLRNYANEIQYALQNKISNYQFPYAAVTPFMASLTLAVELAQYSFRNYNLKNKWALCFDEMEIAPDWLQQEIVNLNLRSRNQRFLFKITSTPDWKIERTSYKDASEYNRVYVD